MRPNSLVGENVSEEMCELIRTIGPGCIVEVGVYMGGTAWWLAQVAVEMGRELYLYDTFTGIPFSHPELGDSHRVGDFSDTSFEKVKENIPSAIITQGVFPESAIEMPPIAFVHLDVDQYWSYKNAINFLRPKMIPGGMMWFDDKGLEGCKRALEEEFPQGTILSRTHKDYVIFP